MKRSLVFVLLGMLISGQALAADWPCFRGGEENQAQSSEHLAPPLTADWTFQAQDKIVSSPVIRGNTVFVGSRDNYLYAIDAESGALAWKFKAGGWIDSTPAVQEDKVYFSSRDGNLYCLNAQDGSLLWKHQTSSTDMTSPLVTEGTIFSGTGFPNKTIYAVDADTGSLKWDKEAGQMVYSSPAAQDDRIFIGSNDGHVYALDKATGREIWSFKTKGGIYLASPSVKGNRVFFAAGDFDWSVYAVDRTDGHLLWGHTVEDRQVTPTYVSSAAVGADSVFVVSGYAQQYLYCLSVTDGTQKWKAALGPSTRFGFSSSPCLTDDTVYAVSAKGMLKAFDIATGRLDWEQDLKSDVLSSPAVANGRLYVGTLDGKLHAFK